MVHLLPILPLLAMLLIAAVIDVRERRIPNWLSLTLAFSGLAQSFLLASTVAPAQAALGALIGFGLCFVPFALGAMGGGDVKLMAAVGAWLGPWPVLAIFAVAAIVGMVIVLVQALLAGRLRALLHNTGMVTVNLIHLRAVGVEHAKATGQSCRSVDKPLPYAVPVLVATAAVVVLPHLMWRV